MAGGGGGFERLADARRLPRVGRPAPRIDQRESLASPGDLLVSGSSSQLSWLLLARLLMAEP